MLVEGMGGVGHLVPAKLFSQETLSPLHSSHLCGLLVKLLSKSTARTN